MKRWSISSAVILGLVLGLCVCADAQQVKPVAQKSAVVNVSITNKGISYSPKSPQTGLTTFVVSNKTSKSRGLVVSSVDPGGAPTFRYSPKIPAGKSGKIGYYLYPGRAYNLKDYTSTRVYGNKRRFTSQYKSLIRMQAVAGFGRGKATRPSYSEIVISDQGINISSIPVGAVKFKVMNTSSKMRGIVITGKDRTGTPTVRYSKKLEPHAKMFMTTWFYNGQDYTVSDYTACTVVPGKGLEFESEFKEVAQTSPKIAAAE